MRAVVSLATVAALSASCAGQDRRTQSTDDGSRAQLIETRELSERVARLELGIRKHREIAAAREQGLLAELEKILSGIAHLGAETKPALDQPPMLLPGVVYAVPIDGAPFDGPEFAPITVVVATDFACAFCEVLQTTLDTLRTEYKEQLKIVYASYPLDRDLGRNAVLGYCAAARQGYGSSMRTELWREQRVGFAEGNLEARFTLENVAALAVSIGAREATVTKDIESTCAAQVATEIARFEKLSVEGLPTVFVNGRVSLGPQRIDTYRKLIDKELVRAKRAFAKGVKLRDYYELLVTTGADTATPVSP